MELKLYTADCRQAAANCLYPHETVIKNAEEMKAAIAYDHTGSRFKDNRRSLDNFIEASVFLMDIDNDHSETPSDWLSPERVEELFAVFDHVIVPSRSNMKEKGTKPARPRMHVYFPSKTYTSAEEYAAVKRAIQARYTFFDPNALDAARFFFGAEADYAVWHEGELLIDDIIGANEREEQPAPAAAAMPSKDGSGRTIPEGSRNTTMHKFALKALKKYGETDKAQRMFRNRSVMCDPPLGEAELQQIWNGAVKFYRKRIVTSPDYVPPDKYKGGHGLHSLVPEDESDIGEAKVLATEYKDELKYTEGTGFIRYNGKVWEENGQAAVGLVEELLDLQLDESFFLVDEAEADLIRAGIDPDVVKSGASNLELLCKGNPEAEDAFNRLCRTLRYRKFVMKYRYYNRISNTLDTAKPMVFTDINELDKNEFLLNTPEATYDLRKGLAGARKHSADDLITKITAVSPGEEGKQLWEDALNTFFRKDEELISYVQEIVGLAAIGKVFLEALIISYGTGRNGKSTFWNTISRVLGTYAGNMSADTLTVGCKRNVKPEMAELKGRRLIIAAELEEGMRLSTSVLKQLCSTDMIYAEKKYKAPFGFIPSHTLVLYTNHLPRVGASDEGTWRRLIEIPFSAVIEGNGDIKNYSDYLFENAGPAILSWIIEGARRVINDKYHIKTPPVVQAAIDAYKSNNDWLGHFLDDCCETGPGLEQKSGELYSEYREYCMKNGEYARSTSDFYTALETAGYERKRKTDGVRVYGLKLREGAF